MRDLPTLEADDQDTFPVALQAWLSPAFPVGSFAYSQGLEWAVETGAVRELASLEIWLRALLRQGSLHNDLILISMVRRTTTLREVCDLAELAAALQPSRERADEALQQGWSFLEAYHAAWASCAARRIELPAGVSVTLPVALGLAARAHDISLSATLSAYGNSFLMTLISAAIRLGAVGQFDGQRCLVALLPALREVCACAREATLDDLGGCTFAADIASMKHETQTTRLFRS